MSNRLPLTAVAARDNGFDGEDTPPEGPVGVRSWVERLRKSDNAQDLALYDIAQRMEAYHAQDVEEHAAITKTVGEIHELIKAQRSPASHWVVAAAATAIAAWVWLQ